MKRCLAALQLVCLQAAAQNAFLLQPNHRPPGPKITLSCTDMDLAKALKKMEKQMVYRFAYPSAIVRGKRLSLDTHGEDLWRLLDFWLPRLSLRDSVMGKVIFIYAAAPSPAPSEIKGLITSNSAVQSLPIVVVVPSTNTGYQDLPRGFATGASVTLDRWQLDRNASANVLDRTAGLVSGLLSDAHTGFSIRTRSTFYANPQPLIVLDNFPYYGNLGNIDPGDIDRVTVLKDANAASIWGSRSANGVIVLTSKKGCYKTAARLHFATSMAFSGKPDLFYQPRLSSPDYIDLEKRLYLAGYYAGALSDPSFPSVTPAVEILNDLTNSLLTPGAANAKLDSLARHDVRNDLRRYVYRNSLSRSYYLDLSGGGADQHYYLSAGYLRDALSQQGNGHDRLSLNATNTYALFGRKLEFTSTIHYTHAGDRHNDPGLAPFVYPYAQLADAQGHPLAVNYGHRTGYIDTAGGGLLQDWNYRPLEEYQLTDDRTALNDYQLQAELHYKAPKGLSADLLYQFTRGQSQRRDFHSPFSYFVRDLRNLFTQLGGQGASYPIPEGGILESYDSGYYGHNFRGTIGYEDSSANGRHHWIAIAGAEASDLDIEDRGGWLYGYDQSRGTSVPVDAVNSYPQYITGEPLQIPSGQTQQSFTDRFVGVFSTLSYTYRELYSLYGSLRKDAANLVGVETNRKWEPFWSLGAAREFRWRHGDDLRLRLSYGCNGNIANTDAYLVTQALGTNGYGALQSGIARPPDPRLGWEKTAVMNAGLDFVLKGGRYWGNFDYYRKQGTGLLGNTTLPPSSGVSNFLGNSAGLNGQGVDLALNGSLIRTRHLSWTLGLLFNYAADRVSNYAYQPPSNLSYIQGTSPLTGRPASAILSYDWAGLDSQGDPQGRLNGVPGTDYASLLAVSGGKGLVYSGPSQPPFFGSLYSDLSWKGLSFSFLIVYKLGYYFRRGSINYLATFLGTDPGHPDYERRWMKEGDEKKTYVPRLKYPDDQNRDLFYQYSSVLVTKGDAIRLQNLKLNYEFPQKMLKRSPFRKWNVYATADNLGILWRANRFHLDPDVTDTQPWPAIPTFTFGFRVDLKTTNNEKENRITDLH